MFHFQTTVTDWPRAVAKLPAGAVIKSIDRGDLLRDAKAANAGVKTVLRHWFDSGQVFGGTLEENRQRARAFFGTFIDGTFLSQYAPFVDYVEEWNEYNATSHTPAEVAVRVTWARAVAEVWSEMRQADSRLAHIRLVLANIAIGNDLPRAYAELALQHDAVLGYHAYSHYINGQRDSGDWRYHSGRWHFMEQAWGLKPRWLFTEAGPYAGVLEGWRHPAVLGGDAGRYVEAVRAWVRDVKATPAYREGRVLGFNLFTTGGGQTWRFYETSQPEMDALADMIREEWIPVTIPTPPPPEQRTWEKTVFLLPQNATRAQYNAVADVAYPTRSEIAFSADSAFARPENVTAHRVVVYDAAGWGGQAALAAWVQQHYSYSPATVIEYRGWPPSGGGF